MCSEKILCNRENTFFNVNIAGKYLLLGDYIYSLEMYSITHVFFSLCNYYYAKESTHRTVMIVFFFILPQFLLATKNFIYSIRTPVTSQQRRKKRTNQLTILPAIYILIIHLNRSRRSTTFFCSSPGKKKHLSPPKLRIDLNVRRVF